MLKPESRRKQRTGFQRETARYYDNDRFLLRTEAYISEGLCSWIMQFGTGIEVVSPASLKEMVAGRAESIMRLYKGDEKDE